VAIDERTMLTGTVEDRILTPALRALITELEHRHGKRRTDLLNDRAGRRSQLSEGHVAFREETAHVRSTEWKVSSPPEVLQERRVELIGGATRSELINGLNAGAKSYIADLWNFTAADTWSMLRAHRSLERAARLDLAYLDPVLGRIRVNPATTTRLMVVPRPLYALEGALTHDGDPVPACFFDLALFALTSARELAKRQGGVWFYLRDVQGHLEARFWAQVFTTLEEQLGLERGTFRVTVMIDTVAGALESDEILFELMHHTAGLSFDPQGYAADHVALFNGPETPVLPDREIIGLNAPFLRALSLLLIGTCHRRGCHAIGAPSFVLPPLDPMKVKASYLEMLADKEREAVDGHDGTIVVHSGTVTSAMMEFNKSMPRANQLNYLRHDTITPADLVRRPEGPITVDSLVGIIRTAMRALVQRHEGRGWVVQGGRLHDRTSLRLALRMLWQWSHSKHGVITATGLVVQKDLLRYLIQKETGKMFADADERTRQLAEQAKTQVMDLVNGDEVPLEPMV
jgi:malate synthase